MEAIGYLARLAGSLFATRGSRRPGAPFAPVVAVVVVLTVAAFNIPGEGQPEALSFGGATLEELHERAVQVNDMLVGAEQLYDLKIAPIERVLRSYRDDEVLARRIALSLAREAKHVGLEPRLLLAVLLVENPWLDPLAVSPVGARGLMQVMPVHEGNWRDCASTFDGIEDNICYGARIFAHYMKAESGDIDRALLRYNGCVRGTNTPDCHLYPQHVYARAGRASVLAWARSGELGGD